MAAVTCSVALRINTACRIVHNFIQVFAALHFNFLLVFNSAVSVPHHSKKRKQKKIAEQRRRYSNEPLSSEDFSCNFFSCYSYDMNVRHEEYHVSTKQTWKFCNRVLCCVPLESFLLTKKVRLSFADRLGFKNTYKMFSIKPNIAYI